jgi:hypothetical protein
VNGVHDMGGVHGFGTVHAEVNEPVFHAEWERRTFALAVALGVSGEWTLDAFRHPGRACLPPRTFEARELWGPEADPTATISVDAFEPYLEAAPLR